MSGGNQQKALLARWLRHAMANQTRFWSLIAALVIVVTGLAIVSNGLSLGRASSDAAWRKIETAKTPSERVEFAGEFPGTPAEQWALLQAAISVRSMQVMLRQEGASIFQIARMAEPWYTRSKPDSD